MKKRIGVLLCTVLVTIIPVYAMTLEGSVEKTEVVKTVKKSWWQRLFGPEPEGRIGVRISTAGNVIYVHPGSPAEHVGLMQNDRVVVVDGRKHAIDDISGDPGTSVHLVVERSDDQFEVDVPRVDFHEIAR